MHHRNIESGNEEKNNITTPENNEKNGEVEKNKGERGGENNVRSKLADELNEQFEKKDQRDADRKKFQDGYKQSDVDKIKESDPKKYAEIQDKNKCATRDELAEANGGKTCWDDMSTKDKFQMQQDNPYRAGMLRQDYEDRHPGGENIEDRPMNEQRDVHRKQADRLDKIDREIPEGMKQSDNPYADAGIEDNDRKAGSGEISKTPENEKTAVGDTGDKVDRKAGSGEISKTPENEKTAVGDAGDKVDRKAGSGEISKTPENEKTAVGDAGDKVDRKAGSGELRETREQDGNTVGDTGEKTDKNKEEREGDRKAFQDAYRQADVDKIKDTDPEKYQSMQEANKMAVYDELKEADGGKTCWDDMSDEERNKMKEENPYRANALEGDYDDRHPYGLEPEDQTSKMKEDVQKNQAARLDEIKNDIGKGTELSDNPYKDLLNEEQKTSSAEQNGEREIDPKLYPTISKRPTMRDDLPKEAYIDKKIGDYPIQSPNWEPAFAEGTIETKALEPGTYYRFGGPDGSFITKREQGQSLESLFRSGTLAVPYEYDPSKWSVIEIKQPIDNVRMGEVGKQSKFGDEAGLGGGWQAELPRPIMCYPENILKARPLLEEENW